MDKILTLNPNPSKKGVNLDKDRYDYMRKVILGILSKQGPLSNSKLLESIVDEIEHDGKVEYSVGWHAMAVKLDLEARGEVVYDRSVKKPLINIVS